ncbi:hypothetical protein P7C70_g6597, partial [Phenoliferia sp. Uapishka_3]
MTEEVCYSLHEFQLFFGGNSALPCIANARRFPSVSLPASPQAENPDELSFGALERIVILERDDQYGDGWYQASSLLAWHLSAVPRHTELTSHHATQTQGRNLAGEIGLFPQSYTSPHLPSESETPTVSHTPEPVMAQHMNDVERSLGQLEVSPNKRGNAASIRSGTSRDERNSDDEGTGPVSNPRAVLALKAAAYAERDAKEEKERAEQRRAADEAAYAAARGELGLDSLQMSDESDADDEEDMMPRPNPLASTNRAPSFSSVNSNRANVGISKNRGSDEVEVLASPTVQTTLPTSYTSTSLSTPATRDTDSASLRSRADTVASSNYAESTHEAIPSLPSTDRSPFLVPSRSLSHTDDEQPATSQPRQTSFGVSLPSASTAIEAVGAGIVGVASAVGITSLAQSSSPPSATTSEPATSSLPKTAESILRPTTPLTLAAPLTLTSSPLATTDQQHLSQPNSLEGHRAMTPTPIATSLHSPNGALNGAGGATYSPSASVASRSSSRLGTAALTAASNGTGDTSPRDSAFGGTMNSALMMASLKALPYDPRTWGVEEVVEWARAKGFDPLTVSKFQEHEISGDVLLEMDVAMLKEIDLTAFGRRVHIYNAIKELRGRTSRPPSDSHSISSHPTSSLAVTPGGTTYEPDSPRTMGFASPISTNFSGAGGKDYEGDGMRRRDSDSGSASKPGSLSGFYDEQQGIQRSFSAGPQTGRSNGVKSVKSRASLISNGHNRTATMDSTGASTEDIKEPIPEEEEDSNVAYPGLYPSRPVSPKKLSKVKVAPNLVIPPRRPSSSSGMTKSPSDAVSRSDSTSTGGGSPREPRPKKSSEHRSSFFGTTLGRSRKPPPREPSESLDSPEEKSPKPRPLSTSGLPRSNKLSSSTNSKRSTRLFGAFGSTGSDKTDYRERKHSSNGTTSSGPSSMAPVGVDAAGAEMTKAQPAAVTSGNLLEKIGAPDYSGWMRKKGEKYNTWKQRFFVLKGVHLYYLKSESEQKIKGFINLTGYRVLADPDIHPGEFGFKIVHDSDRAHYFSAAEQVTVRTWMKEIMKATIGRDYSAAVVSSCNVKTMPLIVAQSMTPRPRPPSPSTRARVQKERYNGSPNTLTPKDAMILMEFSGSPLLGQSTSPNMSRRESAAVLNGSAYAEPATPSASDVFRTLTVEPPLMGVSSSRASTQMEPIARMTTPSRSADLLEWVNSRLPASTPHATDLSLSLRSGQILTRLLERLSGKTSGISDVAFEAFRPASAETHFDASYFDTAFDVFDFISPLVSTDEISMDDMLSGNETQLVLLLERMRAAF